jgi:deoxyribose-phosphate aldolase
MNNEQDLSALARDALRCLDLTSLNDHDGEEDIVRLCRRADGPFGQVAAVCVWPRFAALARSLLPANIAVAAVANFPGGGADVLLAVQDTRQIVQAGAQEVDLVLPYERLMAGDIAAVTAVLRAVREASASLKLKVILETGCLVDAAWIARASDLCLDAGADFLKTSTGKVPVSATPEAARTMLERIAHRVPSSRVTGFKASGGIRTVVDAAPYLRLQREWLGADAVEPARFRIGASSLLDDIESILAGRDTGTTAPAGASPNGY